MALPLLALLPAASALSMSTLARPRMALSRITMCDAAPQDKVVDKQMSNDKLIRFSSLNDEWQPLVTAALLAAARYGGQLYRRVLRFGGVLLRERTAEAPSLSVLERFADDGGAGASADPGSQCWRSHQPGRRHCWK